MTTTASESQGPPPSAQRTKQDAEELVRDRVQRILLGDRPQSQPRRLEVAAD